ncbi:arginine--tRNA ligase [Candidatus Micrarchaeota archaeon]|nr:arginine--tRNA ligase [Candidatus Micrarchaeota archaeon]
MFNQIKEEIAKDIAKVAKCDFEIAFASIENGKFGDISSKIAFTLSKERKENPAKIAPEIAKELQKNQWVQRIEATGPYINFYFSPETYGKIIEEILKREFEYGRSKGKSNANKIMIEFPSVNPNKPWHIGHLRNGLLGDSVARILEAAGHKVERMDYIDDLGLQVAQSLWGFLNFDAKPHGKFDMWLGEQYVGVSKKFEEDKDIVEQVRETLKEMEEGNNEIANAARDLTEKCVKAQYETAFNYGIYHDVLVFESDIMRVIFKAGIEYIKKNNAIELETEGKNAGCWVVKLEGEGEFANMENPDKVLIRSDGTAVYTGKDVIFHLWKFGQLKDEFTYEPFIVQPNGKTAYKTSKKGKQMNHGNAQQCINVIGVEQAYPQKVIAEVFRRLNLTQQAANHHHLAYEQVGLPEGKFSGRKGTWLGYTADELLEEAKERVMQKIKPEIEQTEKEEISRKVAVGAIRFAFLKIGSEKKITFKWEDALNMEGDSGPYAQYAYVRTKSILAKSKEAPEAIAPSYNESEKQLTLKLAQLPQIVEKAAKEHSPQIISTYSLEVAALFSSFYNASPVLIAEDEKTRKSRLAITKATGIVLKNSLELLGIECPQKM